MDCDGDRLEQPPLANTWDRDARGEYPYAVVEALDPESVDPRSADVPLMAELTDDPRAARRRGDARPACTDFARACKAAARAGAALSGCVIPQSPHTLGRIVAAITSRLAL